MADLISMLAAAAGAAAGGGEEDPFFQDTVLLLHGDGTDGSQNNTFLDSSTNNFTITRAGNTTQGTFSPFSKPDGRWGVYFDGSGDYLTIANNAALQFGTGDFTVEGWFFAASSAASIVLFSIGRYDAGILMRINSHTPSNDSLYINGTAYNWDPVTNFPINQWNHVALVRTGTTLYVFVNGTQVFTTTNSANISQSTDTNIAAQTHSLGTSPFLGSISNFRILKGTALYTSAFTPPTAPLTAISGTELLTCQSNRFVDNSSNAFAITAAGNVAVTPFSPFPITTAYSPSVNGGAGYFDGSGDYLSGSSWSSAGVFSTGDFNISFWIYATGAPQANQVIWSCANVPSSGLYMGYSGGGSTNLTVVAWPTTLITASGGWSFNEWHWITLERSSGTLTLYIDGVSRGSVSNTTDFSEGLQYIGRPNDIANYMPQGYISNFRIVKSTATYAVPTAPLTAIANTSLLCNFTNAGILDNTCFNALETVGNAQVGTSVVKFGTGSMKFDGTGDYLQLSDRTNFDFGTGDFTIEGWVYLATSPSSAYTIIDARSSDVLNEYFVGISATSKLDFIYSASRVTSATSVSATTWTHVAVTRESGTIRLFIGGVLDANTASYASGINTAASVVIGGGRSGGTSAISGYYFNGYIDDLRITKGVARYTTTFTPPTKAFPDIGS